MPKRTGVIVIAAVLAMVGGVIVGIATNNLLSPAGLSAGDSANCDSAAPSAQGAAPAAQQNGTRAQRAGWSRKRHGHWRPRHTRTAQPSEPADPSAAPSEPADPSAAPSEPADPSAAPS
ncbi:MAG TPA: hypothetical protein VH912_23050, partial [Streptosporangiaceae bacterium]